MELSLQTHDRQVTSVLYVTHAKCPFLVGIIAANHLYRYTVVPRIAIAPLSEEITLRWTFCHHKSDRFVMVPMGKFRFAMIAGKQNGHPLCFLA